MKHLIICIFFILINSYGVKGECRLKECGLKECGLKCFLNKVKFYVPSIEKKVLFSTLYLTDIVCGDMDLVNISSQFQPPITMSVKEIKLGIIYFSFLI